MTIFIVFMLIIFGFIGFIGYAWLIPSFKGAINESYLNDIVKEITEGKTTDNDKISAVLNWFDEDSTNLYNSWYLTHSGNPYFIFPGTYIIFTTEPLYICYRCFEDNDPRWILTSRCGSCGEYSRLFMIMTDALGYDVRRVHAPGEDHVWNEVKIAGVWIPVDPTNVSQNDGCDGWEDYGFIEWKEGNVSYVWAEYLHNDTILVRTSLYTNLTNVTVYCVDKNNNSISNVEITIMSNNLHDEDRIHETFIKGKAKPKTNDTGLVIFQIGGGTYKFKANSENYSGETDWICFSDQNPSHEFIINLTRK